MQVPLRAFPRAEAARPGLILGVLALGGAAYALLQSLVVPALPVLQHDLHTSPSGVAWVFTSYLLAASVVTPIRDERSCDFHGHGTVRPIAWIRATIIDSMSTSRSGGASS